MIKLNEKQDIILKYYREGMSQRQIARQTGIDRKTVRKYLNHYETTRQQILVKDGDDNRIERIALTDALVSKPLYHSQNRSKRVLNGDVVKTIEYYLNHNMLKRNNGQKKQQMKMVDIHQALLEQGYTIGYTTLRNYIHSVQHTGKEAFIRIHYEPAEILEFDWGEVKIFIDGSLRVLQMAVFTSAYSNYRFAILFDKQDTQCFTQAHVNFFQHTGGVHSTVVYDNMKVAVKNFVGHGEKEPTDALLKMSLYYGFNFRFCNVRRGNEKGHVERGVEYIRRKAFCLHEHFANLQAANIHLKHTCAMLNNEAKQFLSGNSSKTLFQQEKAMLKPTMPPYETAKVSMMRVDKYSTITVGRCHYSVEEHYVGQMVLVKDYTDHIRCFFQERPVGEHQKKLGINEWSLNLKHYLKTFSGKPAAAGKSEALRQADPGLGEIYAAYYVGKEKEFVELLHLLESYTLSQIQKAIMAIKAVTIEVSTEKIRQLLDSRTYL